MNESTPEPATGSGARHLGAVTTARLVGVTAVISLVLGGLVLGPMFAGNRTAAVDPSTQPPEHLITVSGSGLVSTAPDVADVVVGVTAQKGTAKDARASAATSMQAVVASVKNNGVADKDIATINVALSPVYDYSNGQNPPRLVGYQFTNSIRVTVRNLDKVAGIVDDSVGAGATQVQGISFRVDNPKPIQEQARGLAMQDARQKADALAKAAGVSIKGVASVTETSYTPVRAEASFDYAAGKAASAPTPIQTGTTDVQVTVNVAFLIG